MQMTNMNRKINVTFFVLQLVTVAAYATPRLVTSMNETCLEDGNVGGSLQVGAYDDICPDAESIVFSWVESAVLNDPRMAASLLRMHFHDCFVNGCDASVLLDDNGNFVGEKTAGPNLNSLRGFEVIDGIKSDLESICPGVVSCADILALAARDSVLLSNGPGWEAQTGRRDGLSASKSAANTNIPAPNSTVQTLISMFQNVGLTLSDMVALSGAHTLGKARCSSFNTRLQTNKGDINLDFLQSLQQLCSLQSNSNPILADLDLATPATFDNQYYVNLLSGEGLLPSDQVLVAGSNDPMAQIVRSYAADEFAFFEDFKKAMIKMGSIGVLTGNQGQIRLNCRVVN